MNIYKLPKVFFKTWIYSMVISYVLQTWMNWNWKTKTALIAGFKYLKHMKLLFSINK